jgi:hypothetical protein
VSDKTYGSKIIKLLYGIGYGSSPILWALLYQLIISELEEKIDCIRLVVVNDVEEHIKPGESIVDDKTCGTTYDEKTSEPVSSEVRELAAREEKLIGHMK